MVVNPVVACPACGAKNRVPVSSAGHPRCAKCKADLPWLVDAGDADFAAAVDTGLLVVVDLWAPWCGPCRMIAPVLEALSRELAGRIKVVKVNVDDSPEIAQRYRAQSIPMVLIMDRGAVVDTIVGAHPAQSYRSKISARLAERG